MSIIKETLSTNKEVYFIQNKSMKSIIVWFMFYMPLDNHASENALISNILLKGSRTYKTKGEISKFLNENYGGILGTDVNLKGEIYTLGAYINYINPKLEYIKEYTTKDMLKFLNEIIYNPLEVNGCFEENYFEVERDNLLNQLKGKINNKDSYAFDKTIEIMCKDEAYSIDKLGKEEWIKSLENEKCHKRYKDIVDTFPLKIYVMGDVEKEEFINDINSTFDFRPSKEVNIKINHKSVSEVKEINEDIGINQGKLCIGFRTPVDVTSKKFSALSVFNRLFGGGPESKLFLNLREKESLCYTIYSTIEKHKGMIFTVCGIDPKSKDITKEKILQTLENIKNGDFTDEEFSICKSATKHSLKGVKDNKYTYISYLQGLSIYNAPYTLEELYEDIDTLKKEDIVEVAKDIILDTVYFLGRGEENAD